MVELGIVSLLLADTGVSALVSTRVFPLVIPEGVSTLPLIVYQCISTTSSYTINESTGCAVKRVQLDAFADTYIGAKQTVSAIRHALDNFRGVLADGTNVERINFQQEIDYYIASNRTYRISTDVLVTYGEL